MSVTRAHETVALHSIARPKKMRDILQEASNHL